MKNEFVVGKLSSGEMFIAQVVEFDSEVIEVLDPITIKTVQSYNSLGEIVERLSFTSFNPLSDDNLYILRKSNLIYIQRLKEVFVPQYQSIVKSLQEDSDFVTEDHDPDLDSFLIIPEKTSTH